MVEPRDEIGRRAELVRRFNRFYTQKIGVLGDRIRWKSWSLTQARVLYELAHREKPTAKDLANDLELDQGYLSRIVRGFERRRLLRRVRADGDGRKIQLSLTRRGRSAVNTLEAQAHAEISELLAARPDEDQVRLLEAMRVIEELLQDGAPGRRGDDRSGPSS